MEKKEVGIKWYFVSCYSGHEQKVANQISQRVKANDLIEEVTQVLVPVMNKIVIKDGKKKTIKEKMFPGYVLVEMLLNDQTWHLIRNTEGVTGFVGTEKKPTPLLEDQVQSIKAYMALEQPTFKATFSVGDVVKVMDGNFKDFVGTVSKINDDKGQLEVLLSLFGRETPVVLEYAAVTRL